MGKRDTKSLASSQSTGWKPGFFAVIAADINEKNGETPGPYTRQNLFSEQKPQVLPDILAISHRPDKN